MSSVADFFVGRDFRSQARRFLAIAEADGAFVQKNKLGTEVFFN